MYDFYPIAARLLQKVYFYQVDVLSFRRFLSIGGDNRKSVCNIYHCCKDYSTNLILLPRSFLSSLIYTIYHWKNGLLDNLPATFVSNRPSGTLYQVSSGQLADWYNYLNKSSKKFSYHYFSNKNNPNFE